MSTVGALLGKLGSLTGLPISDDVDMAQVGDTGDAESLEAMAELSNGLLGHLLGNAHDNGSGHVRWSLVSDWRRLLFWITAVTVVLLVAAATNPTESSFRSHLTELSFRKHLADIRSSDETSSLETDATGDAGSTSLATTVTTASGSDTPNIAPFRFANHVAISLRTPLLYFKTLFFLSFALTSPLSPPPCFQEHSAGPGGKKHSPPVPKERIVLFLGYFGHWVWVGYVPRRAEWAWRFVTEGTREKGRKKSAIMDRPGILELRAVLPKEDSLVKPTVTLTPSPSVKHMRRVDSSTSLVDHGSLPLHPHPTAIPVAPFVVESRRGSIVNLVPTQTIPPPAAITDLPDNASSPLLTALKADLTAAQNIVNELKAQLHSHETSVSDAHSHLQTSLEDLRTRRKEDDAERQELKTRTKHLEEQKRQAEGARREAEKKLKAVEGVRDGLQAKIAAAMEQVRNMKGMMANSKQAVTGINDDNVRLLVENFKAIEGKRTELEELESEVNELDTKNDELGKAVKEAEERVDAVKRAGDEARKMGPEEEMMMMAAAYEAAAQEGFQHASGPAQHHAPTQHSNFGGASNRNSGPGSDQWASQAAAYMAEAGMPFLDQSYTARPSQSASFGHLAKPHLVPGRVSTPERPSSLAGDLRGFEGFGPGPLSKAIGLERRSSDYQHRASTPPASDSGSDVWGHDPGSPNGGISSSFTANLLPQGLFRSLEGDQTPSIAGLDVDDDDDDDDLFHPAIAHPQDASRNVTPNSVSLAKAVDNAMNENRSASGSEGSDDASAGRQAQISQGEREHVVLESPDLAWRSPLPAPGAVHHQALVQSDHRLLPPSSTTPPGVPSIPGLPSLPDSRRWFSGTSGAASTENLGMSINLGAVLGSGSNHHSANSSNIFGISPSNDSLHILSGGPYDSNSPFAPSAVEKQQLALKWGPLSKYRWGKPQGEAGQQAHSGQRNETGITRSTSHDLSTNGSTSTWLSSRFPSGSIGKKDTSNLSNVFNRTDHHPQDHHQGHFEPMGLSPDHRQGDGGEGQQANLSTSAEKKAFRFFSLRRPNSSGKESDRLSDKLGTSPSSKFGSSPSSKGE